jgi:hypothetical protein
MFCTLHRKLKLWWAMKEIEEEAFILGMHLLAKMVKFDSMEVAGTWSEFAGQVVMRGEEVLAGPVTGNRFLYLGAVQQLHSVVGIFSHIHQDGIEEAIHEAQTSGDFISHHFTKAPGVDSDLMGADTPMIFAYSPWAGYDAEKSWENVLKEGRKVQLPAWVSAGKVKGRP